MFFFYFYLFSVLILGSFNIGPASIRVYMTVFMLLFLLYEIKAKKRTASYGLPKTFIRFFVLFIAVEGLALLLNGEFSSFRFPKFFFAYYFNCFVTYYACEYYLSSTKDVKRLLYFLVGLLMLNCAVTLFQYVGNPIGKAIALALTNVAEAEDQIINDGGTSAQKLFGEAMAVGLFGYTFANANFIGTVGVLLVGLPYLSKKLYVRCLYWGMFFIAVFACMTTQGRTPFVVMILMSIFIFFRSPSSQQEKKVFVIVGLILLFFMLPSTIESDSMGRITKSELYETDSRKDLIWPACIDFIFAHPILGGPVLYDKLNPDMPPHNYFLSAFILSGFLGGIIATYLYFKVLMEAVRNLVRKHSTLLMSASSAILLYSINSLFHNNSIIRGDTLFFIIYPLMIKIQMMEKESVKMKK